MVILIPIMKTSFESKSWRTIRMIKKLCQLPNQGIILIKVVVNFDRTKKIMQLMESTNSNQRKRRNSAAQYLFQRHPLKMMMIMMAMKTTKKMMAMIWSVAMPMYKVCYYSTCILFIFLYHCIFVWSFSINIAPYTFLQS